MGQKQIKKYRKVAEKVAKTQAYYLAQHQVMEIMNAPWNIRWRFALKILFPPKQRKEKSNRDIIAAAHGYTSAKEAEKVIEERKTVGQMARETSEELKQIDKGVSNGGK